MAAKVRLTVEGDKALIADLRAMGKVGDRAARFTLRWLLFRVAIRAQGLTPVDDEDGGQLRDSIRVTNAGRNRRGVISAAVVAGGKPLEAHLGKRRSNLYAIVQHDDTTLKHDDGQAKFVEVPFMQEAPKFPEELRKEIDKYVDRRTGNFI